MTPAVNTAKAGSAIPVSKTWMRLSFGAFFPGELQRFVFRLPKHLRQSPGHHGDGLKIRDPSLRKSDART